MPRWSGWRAWMWVALLAFAGCGSSIDGSDGKQPGSPTVGAPGAGQAANGAAGTNATAPPGSPGYQDGSGAGGTAAPGQPTADNPTGEVIEPFEPVPVQVYLRKVKNLMLGLAPTDAEVATLAQAADPHAALQQLIDDWMTRPEFDQKLIGFFRNVFQQTGFTPTEDFKPQLLENGGFDLGPLGVYGDDAFPRLIQNLQDSFARTALEIVHAGEPFTEVLTTQRFMMTTALKSLYLQIEMPNDQPFNFSFGNNQTPKLAWSVNMSGTPIPLEETLDPSSPNYMVFDDEPPTSAIGFELSPTCRGNDQVNMFSGYAQLFQRLFGFTPRYPFAAQPECWEHASKPYFTTDDTSDWTMVTIRPLSAGESRLEPYDLPALRSASELALALPRVGFFTTPAFLAIWNTNDSNQHRVTANQTLLVALGEGFTSSSAIVPVSTVGLDSGHAVEGSECYGCHKSLDPLREFWSNQYDYNDRNDFPSFVFGGTANPRPASTGGALAFGNVNGPGTSLVDLGTMLGQVEDDGGGDPVNRFAIAMAQQLCFYADSAECGVDDPEFRRVAKAFADASFDFKVLVRELLSSPLVTGAEMTKTFETRNVVVSIARRDHLCAALSNRLGIPDVCALAVPFPYSSGFGVGSDPLAVQRASNRIAGSVPADGFSRGSELPVTPSNPTLFYRAASELLCENVASQVVDTQGSPFSSADPDGALAAMVETIIGYTPSDSHYAMALQILHEHLDEAKTAGGASAADAMRSTFSLACQSPTSLAFGL